MDDRITTVETGSVSRQCVPMCGVSLSHALHSLSRHRLAYIYLFCHLTLQYISQLFASSTCRRESFIDVRCCKFISAMAFWHACDDRQLHSELEESSHHS